MKDSLPAHDIQLYRGTRTDYDTLIEFAKTSSEVHVLEVANAGNGIPSSAKDKGESKAVKQFYKKFLDKLKENGENMVIDYTDSHMWKGTGTLDFQYLGIHFRRVRYPLRIPARDGLAVLNHISHKRQKLTKTQSYLPGLNTSGSTLEEPISTYEDPYMQNITGR
ncbi:hypothetical protein DdX_20241 [Ditylenchus destructor]|uniref:Uncharacterized protein n=1 Tax=Ditylenchus destructor TaxID=166010 RepID=A0AAD4MIC6_9BILA|nr:hypothetical protein DdX_20241 [Ditylenchus destructor]